MPASTTRARTRPAPPVGTRYLITIPAPTRVLTNNNKAHWTEIAQWREAAWIAAKSRATDPATGSRVRLPTGLDRVRLDIAFAFPDPGRKRDRLNLRATTKPVVDGLGPPTPKYKRVGKRQVLDGMAPGYGLLVDDSDAHLDGEYITISPDRYPFTAYGPRAEVRVLVTVLRAEAA